jgi:hypothetical protein
VILSCFPNLFGRTEHRWCEHQSRTGEERDAPRAQVVSGQAAGAGGRRLCSLAIRLAIPGRWLTSASRPARRSPSFYLRFRRSPLQNRVRLLVPLIYQAPTGSSGLSEASPSYEINPLLNLALNKARSLGESLAFPVSNVPAQSSQPNTSSRAWSFSPQAVTFWRSPGGTLLALIVQHNFAAGTTYLTLNTAERAPTTVT